MSDRETYGKYVDSEKSCFLDTEKKEVIDMLYHYKYAFSLRKEMVTNPNIEVEIDVIDKSPFFTKHVKEDKAILTAWLIIPLLYLFTSQEQRK